MSFGAGQFARDACGFPDASKIYGGGIEAPAAGELINALRVLVQRIWLRKRSCSGCLRVVIAAQAQFRFCGRFASLVPHGFTRPGVAPENLPILHLNPGMMVHHSVDAEELDLADLAAQCGEKLKAGVDVITRVGKARSNDQNPSINRGRDEKLAFLRGRKPFIPGAGSWLVQAKGGLDDVGIAAAYSHPP